jgi:hypothetical protein
LHSPLYKVHNDKVPVHSNYTIKISADQVEERHRDKAVVVGYASSKVYWSNGGHYEDGWMVAYPRGFGNFAIMIDSTAPVIKQVNIWNNSNMTYKRSIFNLKFTIIFQVLIPIIQLLMADGYSWNMTVKNVIQFYDFR